MDIGWITTAHSAQIPVGDPDRIAFSLEGEERVTYAELLSLENRYANALLELGVGRGDRVGILLHNCVDYLVLYFAIVRIGAIAVRLNTRLTSEELEFALNDSGTSVLCLQPAFLERLEPIRAGLEVSEYVIFGEPPAAADWLRDGSEFRRGEDVEPAVARPEGGDRLMLMYTSGTTGFPKGSVWTHDTAIGNASSQALELGYDETSVVMSTGPLYHAGAFESLVLPAMLRQGRGIVTKSGGFDIERVVEVAAAEGVTTLNVYPFMLYDMMRLPGLDAERLPSLRCLFTGGDPIMTWALEEAQKRFPGVKVKQGYGLTESVMATILDHEDGMRHPDSVGRPYPLKEVKVVVDDRGAEAAPGEVGEVWIRGAGTTTEYWQRPEETAATFTEGGWLHSGDLGHMSDGLLYLAGRKKDMIRSGGENISAAEVERVLVLHPAIADAAVVAVPDEKYIEVGCAVLVFEAGGELTDAEVIAHCREHLAGYKCPRHVLRLDELPRNEGGKVLKAQLRERTRELGSEPVNG